jgi:acetyltransferase EpsM
MELAIVGEGGHSKVIRDLITSRKQYRVTVILDDKYSELTCYDGLYRGPISSAARLFHGLDQLRCIVAIGSNELRRSIVARLGLPAERYITLIHETAIVSSSAVVGPGSVIMPHTVVNADARVGAHTIINTGAIVEHDCRVGDYAHIAPRATLTGSVTVNDGAMVGAGATIIPGKAIGAWSIIGAGATVVTDIIPSETAVGTPARSIRKVGEWKHA